MTPAMDARSLSEAIKSGDAEAVRSALAAGVSVNARNASGLTPLMQAAFHGHQEVVRLLLEAGAGVRHEDTSGLTASDWALRRGNIEIAELLKNAPAAAGKLAAEVGRVQLPPAQAPRPSGGREAGRAAEEIARLSRELEEVRRVAEEGRLRAEGEADRLVRELEGARKLAEEWARRLAAAEAGRKHAEDEARRASEVAARLRRDYEEERRRAESEARARVEAETARRAEVGAAQPTEARPPAFQRPDPPQPSYSNRLILLTVLGGLLGGGLFGVLMVYYFTTPASVDMQQPVQASPRVEEEPVKVYGALRGREVSIPPPAYPDEALRNGLSGVVTINVEVSDKGDVVSARAVEGHPVFQPAAVQAARKAKFSPPPVPSKTGKTPGVITYTFPPRKTP